MKGYAGMDKDAVIISMLDCPLGPHLAPSCDHLTCLPHRKCETGTASQDFKDNKKCHKQVVAQHISV